MMAERWLDIADIAAVAEDAMLPVVAAGIPLVLVRRGVRVMAFADVCPHLDFPLSSGGVDGGEIVCFWHGAAFDIETGALRCGPAERGLRRYPVRLVDGRVQVDLADG